MIELFCRYQSEQHRRNLKNVRVSLIVKNAFGATQVKHPPAELFSNAPTKCSPFVCTVVCKCENSAAMVVLLRNLKSVFYAYYANNGCRTCWTISLHPLYTDIKMYTDAVFIFCLSFPLRSSSKLRSSWL